MNKKNLVYILPALVLMLIAGYIYHQRNTSTLSFRESQLFEFDSSEVQIIRFKVGNASLLLEKTDAGWMVNNIYQLDPAKFKALYDAHKRLSFQSPASMKLMNRLENIPDEKKVQVQMKVSGKTRSFTMVYDTVGNTGTYVTVPQKNEYYQVFLPGYPRENLTYLYPANPEFWRGRTLISLKPEEIQRISLDYPRRPLASFELELDGDTITASNMKIKIPNDKINRDHVQQYLGYYTRVDFETVLDTLSEKQMSSILQSQPEAHISIVTNSQSTIEITVFNRVLETNPTQLDPNHVYVKQSNFKNIVLMSFIEIAPLLKRIDYFL